MKKLIGKSAGVVLASGALASLAIAQEEYPDRFSIGASIQQLWDSNYSRTPEEEEEEITISAASVRFAHKISRQDFKVNWQVMRYDHNERIDLDATINEGSALWQGEWGRRFSTEVSWIRDSYLVDRLEFFDKDIVERDDVSGKIVYGTGHRMTFGVGARQGKQTHSNWQREGLDYEEDEVFVEIGYQTGINSTVTARFKDGERTYPNDVAVVVPPGLEPDPIVDPSFEDIRFGELDYDYQQAELEINWAASEKTNIIANLDYFNRDGVRNTGSGMQTGIEINWEMTPKVALAGGYSYKQPAIGETSDSPAEIHTVFFDATWQWTEKLSLATGARYSEFEYATWNSPGPSRNESLYQISPLKINFAVADYLSLRFTSNWTDRESPLVYRDYTATQLALGAFFRF